MNNIWIIVILTVTLSTLISASAGFIAGVMAPHIDKRESQKAQERQIPITAQTQKGKPVKQQATLQQSTVAP